MKTVEQVRAEQRAVTERWFDEWNKTGVRPLWNDEAMRKQIEAEWLLSLQPGDKAHVCLYTDIEPCTVIKRTASTITIRYDDAKLNGNWKPEFDIGGFAAHCTNNNEQRDGWDIFEDPDGITETFRWSKKYQKWLSKSGCKLRPEWYKHHDYNF